MVRPLGNSSLSSNFKQGAGPASHASGKGAQQGARSFTPTRAVFSSDGQQEGLDIRATVVPPVSSVPSQGRQPPEAVEPLPAWRTVQTDEVTGFRAEGMAVDEKEKGSLANLSVPGTAVKSVCPVTAILDSGSGISTMSESVGAKLQPAVPDVQIVGPMTDDQYVKMANGKLVLVKQTSCPVRIALHTIWGPVVMDPVSYAVLPGKGDVVILGSPTLAAQGINVYDSLGECMRKHNRAVQGVESPNFKKRRRVSIAVEALLQRVPPEPPDEAVERLDSRGSDVGMEPEQEEGERAVALAKVVETVAANGLSARSGARLCEILDRHWNAFWRGLRGDPPARVRPLTVTSKPETKVVKARGRAYSPIKTAWLAKCIGTVVALGLVFRNLQAVWANAAMAAPKKGGFYLVSDYRAVNKQIEKVSGVMPNQEAKMADLREATSFGKLDMLQGYWQIPLAAEAQEVFTIATPEGLFISTRVTEGILNATAYFQGVMAELLAGLNRKVWVDEIVWWGADEDDLLNTLDKILGRLEDAGLSAATHKCLFFDIEIAWCGKVYSRGQVSHDWERLSGLVSIRRPQTADELMQFFQAVNWLRTSLPRLAEAVEPFRVLLEEHMGGTQRRTKRVASNRVIVVEAWTLEQVAE